MPELAIPLATLWDALPQPPPAKKRAAKKR
jgi:hypothetical protein